MSTTNDDRPRRVAYIGNFGVSFSTESHVALSLEAAGAEVLRVQENEIEDWTALPELFERADVDFAMWTHTHGYADESKHDQCQTYVNEMEERGIPTVGYHLDRWWGLEREHQVYEPFFTQAIVCTADGGHQEQWLGIGVNHIWMPPAVVHTEVGRGTPKSVFKKDVGFLGSWMNYGHLAAWPWRYDMVVAANKRYQAKFRAWPRGGQPIRGTMINDLYASVKVMIGDSCLAGGIDHYWSDRVPETLGRGGFLVHPDVVGLDEEFPIDLPIVYGAGDRASFFDAVDYALSIPAAERDEMIDEAIEFVRARHTYLVRMRRLFEIVDDYKESNGSEQSDTADDGETSRDDQASPIGGGGERVPDRVPYPTSGRGTPGARADEGTAAGLS